MVIAIGQGNYETISARDDKEIYFILRGKSGIIARELKASELDLVMKRKSARGRTAVKSQANPGRDEIR